MKRFSLFTAIAAAILSGCAGPQDFIYKPNSALMTRPAIPASVAVEPFEDATPEWKRKQFMIPIGITVFHFRENYAKAPYSRDLQDTKPFLPPERWARALAEELSHSNAFASVSYAEPGTSPSADLLIRGKVLSALMRNRWVGVEIIPFYLSTRYEFGLQLQAIQRSDNKVLWERTILRTHKDLNDLPNEVAKMLWASMFGEAASDLVKTLQTRRSEWSGWKAEPARESAAPGAGESVEDILKKISNR